MNKSKSPGRKPKGKETRKAVTFRLQPAIIDRIRTISADTGCSMADLIEDMVMECYPKNLRILLKISNFTSVINKEATPEAVRGQQNL